MNKVTILATHTFLILSNNLSYAAIDPPSYCQTHKSECLYNNTLITKEALTAKWHWKIKKSDKQPNCEQEIYTDQHSNLSFDNNKIYIHATPIPSDQSPKPNNDQQNCSASPLWYHSARIKSIKSTADFGNHGMIEAEMRLDDKTAYDVPTNHEWPALWMLPRNKTLKWPMGGELDILEWSYIGKGEYTYGDNIISDIVGSASTQTDPSNFITLVYPGKADVNKTLSSYHYFTMRWDYSQLENNDQLILRYYVDGKIFEKAYLNSYQPSKITSAAPTISISPQVANAVLKGYRSGGFNVILNVAMGGYGGNIFARPDPSDIRTLKVKHIAFYKFKSNPATD